MTETDPRAGFASVCSHLILAEADEESIQSTLWDIADASETHLFQNHRVEIVDDIRESIIENSSGELEEPDANQWSYVIINIPDQIEEDRIHFHCYFDLETFDQIRAFVEEISETIDEVWISAVEADIFTDEGTDNFGFEYGGDEDIIFEGVRFVYQSINYSLYEVEDGSVIRGSKTDSETIELIDYPSFVSNKLDEMESALETLP